MIWDTQMYQLYGIREQDFSGAYEAWQKGLPLYHEAILLYTDRQFAAAKAKFLEVQTFLPHDKPSELYVDRAIAFAANPPPKDWDGVTEIKTK